MLEQLYLLGFSEDGWGGVLLKGLGVTLRISFGAFLVGILCGLFTLNLRIHRLAPIRVLASTYITLCRAVPEILLILLFFYAGTSLVNYLLHYVGIENVQVNGTIAAIIVLGLVQGAYASEIFRSAIQAIPAGQIEAAKAFGMGRLQILRRVTLPLMLPLTLAGMSNLWVTLIKDSALISVIGTSELLFTAKQAAATTKHYLLFYLAAAAVYYVITLLSQWLVQQIERRTAVWKP